MREKIHRIIKSSILQSCNNPNDRNYFCKTATDEIISEMRKHLNYLLGFNEMMLKKLEGADYLSPEGLEEGLKGIALMEQKIKDIFK